MLTTLIKGMALLFAGGSALLATQSPPTYEDLRRQLAGRMPAGIAASDQIGAAVAQWKTLQQANGTADFYSYASFLLANPGWPNEAGFRRAAERSLLRGGNAPALTASYFRRFPATTTVGAVRAAQAFMATGAAAEANAAARSGWAMGAMSPEDEAALLTQFGGTLTLADHDRRFDALMWQGATGSAARVLPLTSAANRQLYAARLAFRTNAPEAAQLAYASAPGGDGDAGYLADKAIWLKTNGASASARTLLAGRPVLAVRPGNVEKWYELLLDTAKGAAAEGQYDLAYRIAARVDDAYAPDVKVADRPYGERDEFTNLTWFAGQTALKQLNRPGDAIASFEAYARGSRTPQIQSKGIFWAGRAAQAAGRRDSATLLMTTASQRFGDQFYGQLATERLGLPPRAPAVVADKPVDASLRQTFLQRGVVRAAQYLGSIGDHETQSLFVRQIATDAKTDADHALANELAIAIDRPDLGVMVGRSALQNGLSDFRASGYPSVAVPVGKESEFTIIHAIARQESQFDRAAVSHAGARGLMQLMPGTAREQAGKLGLGYDVGALTTDTNYNISLGSGYFSRIYGQFGSYPLAIAAYNAGPGNVNKWLRANGDPRIGQIDMIEWIEAIPIYETRNYVQRVLENAVVYDLMHPARSRSSGNARLSWYLGRPAGV